MPFTIHTASRPRVATLLALAGVACAADAEPRALAHMLDAPPGRAYVTNLVHEMAFDMGDHGAEGTRNIQAGFTVEAAGAPTSGTVRLDSVRASLVWGQAQQRIDTRGVVGRRFGLTVADAHAPPIYADGVPLIDMGERGGALPASLLVDYAFPPLTDQPVTVGASWNTRTSGSRLHGFLSVTADITTRHQVTGTETIDGTSCVRVESESSGVLSDGVMADLTVDFTGEVSGTASWCFDAESGALVELASEETASGSAPWPNGATARIDQTTRVAVLPAPGGAS